MVLRGGGKRKGAPSACSSVLSGRQALNSSRTQGATHGIKRRRGRSGGAAASATSRAQAQRQRASKATKAELERERMAWALSRKCGGNGGVRARVTAAAGSGFSLAAPTFVVERLDDKAVAALEFDAKFGSGTPAALAAAAAAEAEAAAAAALTNATRSRRKRRKAKRKTATLIVNPFALLENDDSSDEEAAAAAKAKKEVELGTAALSAGGAPRQFFSVKPATFGGSQNITQQASVVAPNTAASGLRANVGTSFSLFAPTIGRPGADAGTLLSPPAALSSFAGARAAERPSVAAALPASPVAAKPALQLPIDAVVHEIDEVVDGVQTATATNADDGIDLDDL